MTARITKTALAAVLTVAAAAGCGDDIAISGQTVGEVRLVRPSVHVGAQGRKVGLFEDLRLLPGSSIGVDDHGRALLVLDHGANVVVGASTDLTVAGMDELSLDSGRIWVDADDGEDVQVSLRGGKDGKLKVAGCSVSVIWRDGTLDAYVASGELTYVLPGGSGTAREGERLSMTGQGEPEVEPSDLWDDWTGGLAEAGPRPLETPTGVGAIYARRPGEAGQERFALVIRRQEVKVTIEGDLAVTETVQEFFNPASEVLEGIYRLRIPRDAVLQRFAVDRDGTMVDGVVVERKLAQQTYESQVYAGSTHDPALLEWVEPGKFKSRIYPIAPGAVRRIAYRYTQWLEPAGEEGDRRVYAFPMGNQTIAPTIGEFSLSATLDDIGTTAVRAGLGARVDEGKVVFSASDFRPRSDFTLELLDVRVKDLEPGQVRMVTADSAAPEPLPGTSDRKILLGPEMDTYFYTQFSLRPEDVSIEPLRDLQVAVVLDLSAATDQELADLGTTVVDDLLRQLGPGDTLSVLAGDLKVDLVGSDKASEATDDFKEGAVEALGRRPTGGATDIGEILAGAASMVGEKPGGVVIYVGDAFPTVGEMDLDSLSARIDRLPFAVRTYGVALGEESNLDLLTGLSRRGGFAARVSDRTEASELAYRILADASVPVFEDVTFEIDGGVERLYPRGTQTLRVNEPLHILGRLTGEKDPELVTVKGSFGGKPFAIELAPVIEEIDDHGDLKLRWATRRLESLMNEGAGREAVVELGNRFGLVTPYNSILVPSGSPAHDTGSMAPSASAPATTMAAEPSPDEAILGGAGAMEMDEEYGTGAMPSKAADRSGASVKVRVGTPTITGSLTAQAVRRVISMHMAEIRMCHEAHAAPGIAGKVVIKFVITPTGAVQMATVASSTLGDSEVESCVTEAMKGWSFPAPDNGGIVIGTIPIVFETSGGAPLGGGVLGAMPVGHTTTTSSTSLTFSHSTITSVTTGVPGDLTANKKACLLSSLLPLEEKMDLWKERLGSTCTAPHALDVWQEARSRCELATMKDRRALASLILAAVRGIPGRCSLVQALAGQPAVAAYIRSRILASITSPGQVQAVMAHCDGVVLVGPDELASVLEKAKTPDAKIKAVKELIALYPMDLGLQLTLLDILEDEGGENRLSEGMRLAGDLRHAPYADERTRTRVGEFYMRNGKEEEARRTFSEIVEFSPFSPSARRLLGDLYRNYGWAEDAYRQYETLGAMVPEDDSVLILMAEAAADAGRMDEALRLAERVSQSAAGSMTTADIARLFNTIRLAMLRVDARASGDDQMLKEILKRSRRAGVLRDAADLRVMLVWDHPDVKLKLFAQFVGSEVERASVVAPHFGCEALKEKESSGNVTVQVVRDPGSVQKETEGKLYVLWHEGTDKETLQVIDVVLKGKVDKKDEKMQKAWLLSPGATVETKPIKVDMTSL